MRRSDSSAERIASFLLCQIIEPWNKLTAHRTRAYRFENNVHCRGKLIHYVAATYASHFASPRKALFLSYSKIFQRAAALLPNKASSPPFPEISINIVNFSRGGESILLQTSNPDIPSSFALRFQYSFRSNWIKRARSPFPRTDLTRFLKSNRVIERGEEQIYNISKRKERRGSNNPGSNSGD